MQEALTLSSKPTSHFHVLFVYKAKDNLVFGSAPKAWAQAIAKGGLFEAKAGEAQIYREASWAEGQTVLVVGLGNKESLTAEQARRAVAVASLRAREEKAAAISLHASTLVACEKDGAYLAQAVVEGVALSLYRFDELKSKKDEDRNRPTVEIVFEKLSASHKSGFATGQIISKHVLFARRLGDLPANMLTPAALAEQVKSQAKGTKVKVTVWDKEKIEKEKFGGLLGIGKGSDNDPRFIILEYKNAGTKKPIALVGKGLTFDSGGISLKPGEAMDEMKYDMCGAANMIATIFAAAELEVKQNLICLVSAAENMPSARAVKPGDVLTARNGKTMEILNTDAEGRVVLADALSYATEQEPQIILDAATLTGAIMVALGFVYTGCFCNDEKLMDRIRKSAARTGENVWRMPLHEEYTKDIQAQYADIQNLGKSGRYGGSCTAAAFLQSFVGEGIPWAHFDIAGTAWNTGKLHPYNQSKLASGVMIRTWVDFIKNY